MTDHPNTHMLLKLCLSAKPTHTAASHPVPQRQACSYSICSIISAPGDYNSHPAAVADPGGGNRGPIPPLRVPV